MKRILLLAFILMSAVSAFAQTPVILSNPVDWGPWIGLTTTAGNAQRCVDLSGKVITDHTFNYQPQNGVSAITITITGMRSGVQSTITTGTTTTGGSIHFTGTYSSLCFVVTTLTGAGGTVDGGYVGVAAGAGASSVTVSSGTINATLDAETTKVIGTVRAASGGFAAGSLANGASVVEGSTTDAKCLTTDATACSLNALNKAISANTGAIAAAIVTQSSACSILTTASTNSISCKGSAGNRVGFFIINTTATVYYLRIYNTASAPTCSSATGFIQSFPIPSNTTSGAGFSVVIPNGGVAFATGLGYCITASSTSTANDNAAAGIFGELYYN